MLVFLVVRRFRRDVGRFGKAVGFAVPILLAGCSSDPVWITSNLVPEVQIISDSPEVQLLILAQEKSDATELSWLKKSQAHDERARGVQDRRRDPGRYAPTLLSFLEAMAAKPSLPVRGGTRCRLLERSQARCTPNPLDTRAYVKVRITEGPERGQQGWACEVRDVVSTIGKFPF
jgi:hypothetical protein